MLSLHTNAASLSTQNSMGSINKTLSSSMTKLGTGYRVNSAMDDAAGLQIATRLNAQSRGMQVAQKNTQNGISMLQTAEGAMNEVGNMLLRMKDLATESSTGTSTQADRDAMQAEFDALGSEISNILKNTTFAGSTLFSKDGSIGESGKLTSGGVVGNSAGITFQVGATVDETIEFNSATGSLKDLFDSLSKVSSKIGSPTTAAEYKIGGFANDGTTALDINDTATTDEGKALALMNSTFDATQKGVYVNETGYRAAVAEARETINTYLKTNTNAVLLNDADASGTEIAGGSNLMIDKLTDAINAVGTFRSDLGAVANRLEHTFNNLGNMITNTDVAKGRIMDVDYAKESATMTKNQMLMQVSTSMLKQSNSLSQMVGSLVQ